MNPAIMILCETIKVNHARLRMTGMLLGQELFNMLVDHIHQGKIHNKSYCWVDVNADGTWARVYMSGVNIYPKGQINEHSSKDPD